MLEARRIRAEEDKTERIRDFVDSRDLEDSPAGNFGWDNTQAAAEEHSVVGLDKDSEQDLRYT